MLKRFINPIIIYFFKPLNEIGLWVQLGVTMSNFYLNITIQTLKVVFFQKKIE